MLIHYVNRCFNSSPHVFLSYSVFLSMNVFKWLLIFLPILPSSVNAQLTYTFQNDIEVVQNGISIPQPFAGGFVAPQYSTIDLNFDGMDDLFVFDRASSKISTFLFQEGKYVYAPQYESLFPTGLKNWVLLRDYNCDGKVDLFTSSLFGMSLYENISISELSWELKYQTINTEGSNGQTNLQVSSLDLPAIIDVDNDGDLDILNFNFATGEGIEFHKNMSVENSNLCELDLVRVTKRYGDFEECTCETYVFGTDECLTSGREEHSGGKTILSFNNSNQLVQDLIIGQEYCLLPGYLPNSGTTDQAKMTNVSFDFPDINNPLRMEYPAFYALDLYNNDSIELVASPNSYVADGTQNYEGLSFLYEQDNQGEYHLLTDNFLKEEMIDVGHKSAPVFVDIDFDGDEDLIIGNGKTEEGASLWLYENIGSATNPSFEKITDDYLNFKNDGIESIKLQVFDIDANGFKDLVLYKVAGNEMITEVLLHTGNPITPYSKLNASLLALPDLSIWDSPFYFGLGNQTGLIIGKQGGSLEFYTTSGDLTNATWQLVSSEYLGIKEDFSKRNLRVLVADLNGDGMEDMLSYNDSGEALVYYDFISKNDPESLKGKDISTDNLFNLSFGKLANPSVANVYGTLEPSLAFGLLQGGINLLKNTQSTNGSNELPLKVIVYPNPIENYQTLIQANKKSRVRVLDALGKQILKPIDLLGGEQKILQLELDEGVYFVEVVSEDKQKSVTRIVIAD